MSNILGAKLVFFFEVFMLFVYFGMGVLFLFIDRFKQEFLELNSTKQYIFAAISFVYAIVKAFRLNKKRKAIFH